MSNPSRVLRDRKPRQISSRPEGISKRRNVTPPAPRRTPNTIARLESAVLETLDPEFPPTRIASPVDGVSCAVAGPSSIAVAIDSDSISSLGSFDNSEIERINTQSPRNGKKRKADDWESSPPKRSKTPPSSNGPPAADAETIPLVKQEALSPSKTLRRSPRNVSPGKGSTPAPHDQVTTPSSPNRATTPSAPTQATTPQRNDSEASTFVFTNKGKRKAIPESFAPSKRLALPVDQNESFRHHQTSTEFMESQLEEYLDGDSDWDSKPNSACDEEEREEVVAGEMAEEEDTGEGGQESSTLSRARAQGAKLILEAGSSVMDPFLQSSAMPFELPLLAKSFPLDARVKLDRIIEQQAHMSRCVETMLGRFEELKRAEQRNNRLLSTMARAVGNALQLYSEEV